MTSPWLIDRRNGRKDCGYRSAVGSGWWRDGWDDHDDGDGAGGIEGGPRCGAGERDGARRGRDLRPAGGFAGGAGGEHECLKFDENTPCAQPLAANDNARLSHYQVERNYRRDNAAERTTAHQEPDTGTITSPHALARNS